MHLVDEPQARSYKEWEDLAVDIQEAVAVQEGASEAG